MMTQFVKGSVALLFAVLFIAGVYQLWQKDWPGFFVVLQAILLSLVPVFIRYRYGIHTPNLIRAGIAAFCFATLFLGEVSSFYSRFWWWDIPLHFISGFGLTIFGLILHRLVYPNTRSRIFAFYTSIFAFTFSLAIGVLWEIYEFLIDLYFTFEDPMQPGNSDTMGDLIAGVIGGLLAGYTGYLSVREKHKGGTLPEMLDEIEKQNAHLI